MIDIDKEQPTIKQYLLRRLDEEGQQRFEERFVTDSEFREVALVVEDELIEDYLAGLLTATQTSEISRAPHQGQKVLIPGGINIVQFLLGLSGQPYQSYEITLHINDSSEVFTVSGLHAEDTGEARIVRLRIPARLLTHADYVLKVRGVNAAGQAADVAEYFFRAVK